MEQGNRSAAAGKAKKVVGVQLIEEAVVAANENAKLYMQCNCSNILSPLKSVTPSNISSSNAHTPQLPYDTPPHL